MIFNSPTDLYERLGQLRVERAFAKESALSHNPVYMADLDGEIAAVHAAWVGAAVTEIAILRAELSGAPQG